MVLAWIGAVVLVLAVVVGAIMAVLGIRNVSSTMNEAERFQQTIEISGTEGKTLQLYKDEEDSSPVTCEVLGADGSTPSGGTSQNSSFSADGVHWASFDSFTPDATQNYTIACDSDADIMVAPPVSVGGIFAGIGGLMIAIFAGGPALLVLILGLVLYFVGRSQAKQTGA